jgi:hypothetical protein
MCLVYRDEANRRRIVAEFVESGLLDGERVYYFADTAEPSEVVSWLESLDVRGSDAMGRSTLTIDPAVDTYCPDGAFDVARMCDTVRRAYTDSRTGGYPASRVTGEMSWALRGFPGSDRLMEYEAEINAVVRTHPITAMCQYDANRFDGELIFLALQVHPYLVMNGQLVQNPYFAPAG